MGARNRVGVGLSYRPTSAGILDRSMGARNRVGIGLSYWLARLHMLAELIPGLLKSLKSRARVAGKGTTQPEEYSWLVVLETNLRLYAKRMENKSLYIIFVFSNFKK
jgi:hypothetical protein